MLNSTVIGNRVLSINEEILNGETWYNVCIDGITQYRTKKLNRAEKYYNILLCSFTRLYN